MSSKLKTWFKRGLKFIGALAALVILLLLVLLLVLETGWGKGLLRDQVLKIANNSLAGTVGAERIEGNLLGGLRLYGVSVYDARENLVARVPEVSADYSLIRLVRGELKLNSAALKEPLIIARVYPDGEMNVLLIAEDKEPEPSEPSSFQVSLDSAEISGASLLYLDETGFPSGEDAGLPEALSAWLEAANQPTGAEESAPGEQLSTLVEAGDFPSEGFALAALTGLDLEANFHLYGGDTMGAQVPNITGDLFTNLSGPPRALKVDDIRFLKTPSKLEASMKEVAVGAGTGIKGLVAAIDFDTELDELQNPVITAPRQLIAQVGQLRVDRELIHAVAPEAPVTGDLRATLSLGGTPEQIYLHAQAGCGENLGLALGGELSFPDEDISRLGYDLALALDDLSSAECVDLEGMDARLNGAMSASGQGIDPETLSAELEFSLHDSSVGDYQLERLSLNASARGGHFELENLAALTPYGALNMQADFELKSGRYSLNLDANADERIRELLAEFGEQSMQTKFARVHLDSSGQVDLEADAPLEMLSEAELDARWDIEDARVEKNRLRSSQGELELSLEPRSGDARSGRRSVDFRADINARGLDSPLAKARLFSLDASGSGQLDPGMEDPLSALEELASRWKIRAQGLSTPDLRVNSANIQARVDKKRAAAPFSWSLNGGVRGVYMDALSLGEADLALRGDVALLSQERGVELGQISARGAATARRLEASGNSVDQARVDLNISGRPPALAGKVDLKAKDIRAGGERLEKFDATVDLTRDLKFNVQATAARLLPKPQPERAGALEVPEEPVEAVGEEEEPEVQELTVSAAGDMSREFKHFGLDNFSLNAPGLTLQTPQRATVDLRGADIRVQGLKLESDDFSLSVDGTYSGRGQEDLHLVMDNLDLGRLREKLALQELMPPLQGRVDGRVDLEGTAREPILDINISVRDFFYEDYGPIEIDLIAGYKNRRADIEIFEVRAYQSTLVSAHGSAPLDLNLAGEIEIPFDSPLDLKVEIPRLDAENFYEPFPPLRSNKVEGSIQADMTFAGTVYDPVITLEFDADDFQFLGEFADQEVEIEQMSTRLRASYEPPSVGRGGIDANYRLDWRGDEIVTANLATPLPLAQWVHQLLDDTQPIPDFADEIKNLPINTSLKIAGLDLKDVPVEMLAEADAAGSVFLELKTDGTFADPRADLETRLEGFAWNQYRDIDLVSELQLRDQVLQIKEMQARWVDEPVLTAQGKVPLPTRMLMGVEVPDDLPINFEAELHEMALNRLGVIDYEFARYEGSIGAFLKMEGTLREPDIHGRAGLFNTRLAEGQFGTIALEFDAREDRARAKASVCQQVDTVMELRADVPVLTDLLALAEGADPLLDGPIHARLNSDRVSLGEILPEQLISQWASDLEGDLSMNAEIEGTWEQPRAEGKILVEDAALTLPMFGRRFTDINLDVEASHDQIKLNELHIADEDTSIIAHADLKLEDMAPAQLKADVRTDEFSIAGFVPGIAASVSSETDITGDLRGDNRKVRAHITKLNVTMPQTSGENVYPTELDDEITVLSRQKDKNQLMDIDRLLASQEGEGGRTRTAVRVVIDRGSWFHHPMADVEFRADITATLGGPEVEVTGSIGTVRGSAVPLGKQFDVPEQENAIRFTGDSPPDPALDIRAIHPLDRDLIPDIGEPTEGDPRIMIYVRGRATEPKLVMESDPAMTETEILYVLMTGRAPNQAGAGEESRVSNMALGAASGIFAGMLQEQLSGTLPLDVVRLQPGEEGFRDMSLQVGKYVTDDIFVSYVLRLGADEAEGMNLIKVDYRFLPSWRLGLELSNQLNGDLNVFWNIY